MVVCSPIYRSINEMSINDVGEFQTSELLGGDWKKKTNDFHAVVPGR
jgi:hypothetical protein